MKHNIKCKIAIRDCNKSFVEPIFHLVLLLLL
ncbi:hypothetical protein CVS40_12699 [Lucilia cuprina]|nr:hypothetical protein CVS40_12699 [Lucilia cuprina]